MKKDILDSYVVRIYRCDQETGTIMGAVERAAKRGRKTFNSEEELVALLKKQKRWGKGVKKKKK